MDKSTKPTVYIAVSVVRFGPVDFFFVALGFIVCFEQT